MKKLIYQSIILILIFSNFLIAQQQESWTTFTKANGLADNNVKTIIKASDGALWFGTERGVSRYYQESWTTFITADGLASNKVFAILESSNGALWFGTYEGVSCYYQGKWTTFTTARGLADNYVRAIIESSDGALWFGTQKGVSRYYQERWTTFTVAHGLANSYVLAILESSDGVLWFGSYGGGVCYYSQEDWITFTTAHGLADNHIFAIFESSDGALWFGTYEGLSRYYQGSWTRFTTADGLTNNNVYAILESSDGSLWFGTDGGGVSRLKPDKLIPVTLIIEGPKSLIGTSTPMFLISGIDNYTKKEELLFSYVFLHRIGDISLNPNLFSWSPYSKRTVIQPEPLQNGNYTFYVRAKDSWGHVDPNPAKWNFTVDITPLTTVIDDPANNAIVSQKVLIKGYAYDDSPIKDFDYYSTFYGKGAEPDGVTEWYTIDSQIQNEVRNNDTLAIWNATGFRGTYQLKLFAKDSLGHENEDIITVHVFDVTREIKSQQGGHVSNFEYNIDLYFPPNSLSDNTNIKIKLIPDMAADSVNTYLYKYTGLAYDILPDTILEKPATLMLSYNDSNLIHISDEKKLSIFRYNKTTNNWQHSGGTLDMVNRKIITSISELGRYGLFENLGEGTEFSLSDVNCQPRIFSPKGDGHDIQTAISFELGTESNVTIKIYNPAGRLVNVLLENERMSHGNNVVYWDGKDQQGEFCVSGLYIVTIQAEEKMATKTVVVLNK